MLFPDIEYEKFSTQNTDVRGDIYDRNWFNLVDNIQIYDLALIQFYLTK